VKRRPYAEALPIAERLREDLAPYCERGPCIAGSLRRHTDNVKDIEYMAIPKTQPTDQMNLFDEGPMENWNLLHGGISELSGGLASLPELCEACDGEGCETCTGTGKAKILPIKPGSAEPDDGRSWTPDGKWKAKAIGKSLYFRLWLPRDKIRVDVFMTTPERWGAILAIRTGPADFSQRLVQHWTRTTKGHFHNGRICPLWALDERKPVYARTKDGVPLGEPFDTPKERDVFDLLGIRWVRPEDRYGVENIVAVRR
jgi:hypothetical protein